MIKTFPVFAYVTVTTVALLAFSCGMPEDPCASNPCTQPNKTRCISMNGQAFCFCDLGYQQDPYGACIPGSPVTPTDGPCAGNPCIETNKNVCVVVGQGYLCKCNTGFTEDPTLGCVQTAMTCDEIECTELHKGKCVISGGVPTCTCDDGYESDGSGGCKEVAVVEPEDPCDNKVCGTNQTCYKGMCICLPGFMMGGQGECAQGPACNESSCDKKAFCDPTSQVCLCKPGFEWSGLGCVPPTLTPFEERTKKEVCARFVADWTAEIVEPVSEGTDPANCLPGTMLRTALNDGLQRTNMYRWFVGLPPVWDTTSLDEAVQECALLQHHVGAPDHYPPAGTTCYSPKAAQTSASSNIAQGCTDLQCAVNLFVKNPGVESLGHRRWVLCPKLTETGFGLVGEFACMYALGTSDATPVAFVAWPPPGYFPKQLLMGTWFIMSDTYYATTTTSGKAKLIESGATVNLVPKKLGVGYCMNAFSLTPDYSSWPEGKGPALDEGEIEVTLLNLAKTPDGPGDTTLQYVIKIVECQ